MTLLEAITVGERQAIATKTIVSVRETREGYILSVKGDRQRGRVVVKCSPSGEITVPGEEHIPF